MGHFYNTGGSSSGRGGIGTNKNLVISYSPSKIDGTPAFTIYHAPLTDENGDPIAPTVFLQSGINVLGNTVTLSRKEIGNFLSFLFNDGEKFYVDTDGMVNAQGSITGGVITVPSGNQVVDMESGNYFESTPAGDGTWTTTTGREGQVALLHIDNTGVHTLAFGSGFTDVASITDAGIVNKLLYYDGATWREIAIGGGGLPVILENQTLRGNSSNEIEANNYLKLYEDGAEVTVSNNTDANSRIPNLVFFKTGDPVPDPDDYTTRTALIEYEEGSSGWNLIDDNEYGYLAGDISADGSICYFTDERRLYKYDGIIISEIRPDGDRDGNWISVACSADGTFIIVCEYNHRIWISSNSGTNFTETRPDGDSDYAWRSVDCDSDGSFLIACYAAVGSVYISSNGGTSWSDTGLIGENGWWFCVACDSDGSNLIVVENDGYVQISTNSGANWLEKQPDGIGTFSYQSCAISGNGLVMIISEYGGRISYSVNSGANWSETQPDGDRDGFWGSYGRFICNSDGSVVLVYEDSARLWRSVDSCFSWDEVQPDGDRDGAWSCLALDNTSNVILAGDWNSGKIFIYLVEASIIKSIRIKHGTDWMLYTPESGGSAYTVVDPVSLTGSEIGFKYDTDYGQLDKSGNYQTKGNIRADGTVILSADWDIGNGRAIKADKVIARDADGISIQEDSGTYGVNVNNDGDVTVKLGDKAGVRKLIIQDSDGTVMHTVDSDGVAEFVGSVKYDTTAVYDAVYDNGNSGASKTIDWRNGNKQKITTTANCTLTFTAPGGAGSLQLIIRHENSATAYEYTYPANVNWAGHLKYVTKNTAYAKDIISFLYDPDWFGSPQYFATGNGDFGV